MTDLNLQKLNAHPSVEEYRWATFIPSRRSGSPLKVHRLRGHARSALTHAWGSKEDFGLYERIDGQWIDRTTEWREEDRIRVEAEKRKREEIQRLRALCPYPCAHCTVRKQS